MPFTPEHYTSEPFDPKKRRKRTHKVKVKSGLDILAVLDGGSNRYSFRHSHHTADLALQLAGKVSRATVYRFFRGGPISHHSLEHILDMLGYTVVKRGESPEVKTIKEIGERIYAAVMDQKKPPQPSN